MIVEVISIVLAILLAVAVNRWQEDRRTASDVTTSLSNIRAEVALDEERLDSEMQHHLRVRRAMERLVDRPRPLDFDDFFGTFFRLNPRGLDVFSGETFAWDVARSSPSVTAIPYGTRLVLERTYHEQAALTRVGETVVADLHVESTSREPDFYLPALALSLDLGDLVASEDRLRALYATARRNLQ